MTSPASDPAQPAAARIYDYLLGGKDNYAVDRAASEKVLAVAPDQRWLAQANRAFAIRAVRVLAEAGVRQFIDLGTGFPTSPSVHEAARQADPSARVVYVDHDPVCTRTTRRCWPPTTGWLRCRPTSAGPRTSSGTRTWRG